METTSFWEQFGRHRIIAIAIGVSLALVLGGWLWAYLDLRSIPPPLILHFNVANLGIGESPIEMRGTLWDLAGFGSFGVFLVILNGILAIRFDERDWFLGKLIAGSTFLMAALIFIAFSAIISVN